MKIQKGVLVSYGREGEYFCTPWSVCLSGSVFPSDCLLACHRASLNVCLFASLSVSQSLRLSFFHTNTNDLGRFKAGNREIKQNIIFIV